LVLGVWALFSGVGFILFSHQLHSFLGFWAGLGFCTLTFGVWVFVSVIRFFVLLLDMESLLLGIMSAW